MVSVAIDGPGGAGKSTLAKRLATTLQYVYVDTGAMYRAIGLYCYSHSVDTNDEKAIEKILPNIKIELKYIDGVQHIMLNEQDVTTDIRAENMGMAASAVSAKPCVREFLLNMQRDMTLTNNVLMDGRDIGTVVLPNATVKIYLTASEEIRAKRRHKELLEKGIETDFDAVLQDIKVRDYNDMNRDIAPLKQADDAILVDTSDLDFEESFETLLSTIKSNI